MSPSLPRDRVVEADQAERSGALAEAAATLRSHLENQPGDAPQRLRLARILTTLGEHAAARQILLPLDRDDAREAPSSLHWGQANRMLAELDERDGALASAQLRWERALADDIDDPVAEARLQALRPDQPTRSSDLSISTLASPEGVRTSRYRLVRELGRGSSAAVYLVVDERLDLPLALKVLHPQLGGAAGGGARSRFFAEARLVARLRHPGVVALYDLDETTRSLAMEYVAGGTIRERLRLSAHTEPDAGAGSLDPNETAALARSLLAALAYVHAAGVVHGDIKPGNVLLRTPGDAVLADFGAAQLTAAQLAGGIEPEDDRPAGTPLYLAPEQLRGSPASELSDLYSAGAILWEATAGHPLREGVDLLRPFPTPPPPLPVDALAPLGERGARLAHLITRLVAFNPSDRPASAAEALASL